jgi:curved DNA-binding protein CbpA
LALNHYQILGVPYNAPRQDIKKAFRTLAICYHPDVTRLDKALAEGRFKQISEAYWILKDPKRRREYNRILSVPPIDDQVIYQPPSWEYREEEWIWDERQLRYRKKWTVEEGEYEARAPFSSTRGDIHYRRANLMDRLKKRVYPRMRSSGLWLAKRARNTRLKCRLLLDRIFRRRLYTWHSRRPHKILKARST